MKETEQLLNREPVEKKRFAKFDVSDGKGGTTTVRGELLKENKLTVLVEYNGPKKRAVIKRHKIKHCVEIL